MGLVHLLITALAASAVMAADKPCACVKPEQTLDPINNPMIFFQQPTLGGEPNGVKCAMNCTLIAHAADETVDGLVVQILANDLNSATITVVDGPRTFKITKNTVQADITWKSTGGVLEFDFEGEVNPVGTFMIVVQKSITGRDPLPSVIPVTTAAPTEPYDNLKYHNNPLLVANDIMIGIDLSSPDIANFKAFATDLINTLTISNATDCGVGTRLALHGLTNFQGFSPTYFPDWQYVKDTALGNIAAMSQIGDGPYYIDPVPKYVSDGFKDNQGITADEPDRCLNRGRIYILISSNQPVEYKPANADGGRIVNFIERGVHPILVTSLKADKRPYYDQYKTMPTNSNGYNSWTYFNIDNGVTDFINSYLVDNIPDMTCQLDKDSKVTLTKATTSSAPEKVSIPPYYEGMLPGSTNDADWDKIKHYCNFQSTTVTIEQSGVTADLTALSDVCIKVYYDLETDQDFVTIYSGDYAAGTQRKVVKLTGRDVSGSTFQLHDRIGSIVFSSDEKNVYDGFYAEIYPCGVAFP